MGLAGFRTIATETLLDDRFSKRPADVSEGILDGAE